MSPDGPVDGRAGSESVSRQLRLIRPAMRVLFVDPDVAGAERLAHALRAQHTVAVVGSAQAAMATVERWAPDLIVAELNLPDANGIALVAQWRTASATRHTLLMIVTVRRSVRDKIAGLQAGADDYLIKPVELSQFLAHVAAISRFRQIIRGPLYG